MVLGVAVAAALVPLGFLLYAGQPGSPWWWLSYQMLVCVPVAVAALWVDHRRRRAVGIDTG